MADNFYTNVQCFGKTIYFRGIVNGRRVRERLDYAPSLYIKSKKETGEYMSLDEEPLEKIQFENIKQAKDYLKRYDGVEGFKIFGNTRFENSFIADNYPGIVNWSMDDILIGNIDIEVKSDNGRAALDTDNATEEVLVISFKLNNGMFYCLHRYKDYKPPMFVKSIYCDDEIELLKTFLDLVTNNPPDIWTGWNIKYYDIPYLFNRIKRLLGEKEAKRMSCWGMVHDKIGYFKNKPLNYYKIIGSEQLDYKEVFQKFDKDGASQESYKLHDICQVKIGEGKLSYEEYDSLHDLWAKNPQKYIDYNIQDVNLVSKLDAKLKLIELALTLAYYTHSNYEDVFTQVRMWDSIIYNFLIERKIVIPPRQDNEKNAKYEGAYVKEPKPGKYGWVVSFDLASLYPHLIMQYNISPETFVPPEAYSPSMRKFLAETNITVDTLLEKKVDTSILKKNKICLTPNRQFFRIDKQGFLAEIMETMFNDRSKYKNMMLDVEKQIESGEGNKAELEAQAARYKNMQLALKVGLNSAYGAMGNEFFRFFDVRYAAAITTSAQLSIRWVAQTMNDYLDGVIGVKKDRIVASDTDSIYVVLDDLVKKVMPDATTAQVVDFLATIGKTKLQKVINDTYTDLADYVNAYAQKMNMKREAIADVGIWTGKKRYALNLWDQEGVRYNEAKIKVTGLEVVQSTTPAFCRENLKKCIELCMRSDERTVQEYIKVCHEKFKNLSVEEITSPSGMNGLEKYSDDETVFSKGTPGHVKGSLLYNDLLKRKGLENRYPMIMDSEKIKYVYLKKPNPVREHVISFPGRSPKELGMHEFIDFETQWEKTFLAPITKLMKCIGWHSEKTNSLEDFFADE